MAVHQPNSEPLPGYRLLNLLGEGDFGEVWRCAAPGGLSKAIKFVAGPVRQRADTCSRGTPEIQALQRIQSIQHPFLLSLDRVERLDGDLVIVMDLAERSLEDLLLSYRGAGQAGIPRPELLGYLRETAEVLDLLNHKHDLQHLNVKPGNLFVVAGHVKVADFGLVSSVAEMIGSQPTSLQLGALAPVYAAPESFLGNITSASDQYSLAIVYHELLTGKILFNGKNFRQLAMQHMQSVPDLSALPEADRPAVARALSKEPKERFPSCSAFVQALAEGMTGTAELRVPARTFFAMESQPKQPKRATAVDGKLGETYHGAPVAAVPPSAVATVTSEFAGLRLLECLSRQASGELWRGLTADGKKRLVRFMFDVDRAGPGGDPFARAARLRHPHLAKVAVVCDGPNRIALVTEAGDDNLGIRLKECIQAGMPGIPRVELLSYLSAVAAALDDLFAEHRLLHLTLAPRTVTLIGGQARLMDFALAELFWLGRGQQAGALNTRYAAPELFDGQVSPRADQYSLALLFQEMLTGVHPFRNLNARQMASAQQRGTPDLGMLSAADRVLLLRALHLDPERRFGSNEDFIEALQAATVNPKTQNTVAVEPTRETARAIVPSRRPVVVASPVQVINELLAMAAEGREVRERNGMRFLLTPGVSILHHCCARLIRSVVPLKVAGFREQWKGQLVEHEEGRYLYHLPLSGSLWRRALGILPSLAVEICCEFPTNENEVLTDASIQLWPLGCSPSKSVEILETMGPPVLESVRTYLNANPERRAQMRLPFEQTVQVQPVFDGEPGEALLARMQDISQGGMNVRMASRPRSAQVCVLVSLSSRREPEPVSARVMRVKALKDGNFEIGLAFV